MNERVKVLGVFATVMLLAGCVVPHQPEPRWYKLGVTDEEAQSKYASCVYNVGMNKVDPTKDRTLVEACMKADGFRWGIPPHLRPSAKMNQREETSIEDRAGVEKVKASSKTVAKTKRSKSATKS
ncbi:MULTISPECIES: hypothetical protein [Pasteurellaceae]|uniref:Lipoprotein n=1 Tax=Rodentibacter genomosp. 1 TaxID=1908264 RepID=A0A1V3JAF0_9PAST|nr:hypothetical protein [Rodentibacter genomosp. 1]MBF0750583.1 hypothetical protein [Pasteurella sp. 19428wF3_WM03]OOF52139.1 hypothetical protein BKK54_00520 [Rodentibacter genomosp. 1]TFU52857.1 hypothetical protein E4T92_00140 [Pasteurella sp. WM03]